jgi:hypothetical protein
MQSIELGGGRGGGGGGGGGEEKRNKSRINIAHRKTVLYKYKCRLRVGG